jgi:hypothetical protein
MSSTPFRPGMDRSVIFLGGENALLFVVSRGCRAIGNVATISFHPPLLSEGGRSSLRTTAQRDQVDLDHQSSGDCHVNVTLPST